MIMNTPSKQPHSVSTGFIEISVNASDSFEYNVGLILDLHLANETRRYKVTPSLIGWAQT